MANNIVYSIRVCAVQTKTHTHAQRNWVLCVVLGALLFSFEHTHTPFYSVNIAMALGPRILEHTIRPIHWEKWGSRNARGALPISPESLEFSQRMAHNKTGNFRNNTRIFQQ